ncbi:MAG: M6 family metalloprotease domain-containing protein [bacterium]
MNLNKLNILLCGMLILLFIGLQIANAVPANGVFSEYQQPDGTKFTAKLLGDEWYSWHETAEGYTIIQDRNDGFWKYAVQDTQGFLQPGAYRVGVDNPTQLGLMKKVQASKAVIRTIRQRQYLGLGITAEKGATITESTLFEEPQPGEPPRVQVTPKGNVKNLVILCSFSDHDTTKYLPAVAYDSLFNTVGYNFDAAVGSVRDYYVENSYGQLTILSTIAYNTWIPLPHTELFYGGNDAYGNDSNARQMISDALAAIDPYIDFSLYDVDGDGYVDSITFIHSGYDEAYSGNPSSCIWSHKWSLSSPYVTGEGVRVSYYHTEPALRGLYTSGRNMGRIGVVCHETGHFFGLPDLYDTDGATGGSGQGAGAWSLMASGSWGANGSSYPERPTHFDAWCKFQLGWLNPTILHTKTGQLVTRVETNKSLGKVTEGLPLSQYYLLENRQTYGFDTQLLGNGGLLIWHIDDASKDNNTLNNYMVALEEADGNLSLQGSTRAQTGDPYPGSSANTTFSPYSNPSTYSNPIGSGTTSYISVLNISTSASGALFNLRTLVPTMDNPSDNTTGSYTVSWSTSVNATQYMLAEGSSIMGSTYTDGAESETQFREDWTKLGDFRKTNQNSSAGSYSYLARWCDDPASSGGWTIWNSDDQFLTLNQPFLVTSTTQVTFKTRYYLQTVAVPWQRAYLQVRRATEDTWNTISTFRGDVTSSWASVTIGSSLFSGFSGTTCYLRFAAINHSGAIYSYYTTTSNWPWNGFAFDEFAINNAGFATFSWSTLASNIVSTSTTISGKTVGTYAYKVAGYANSTWQNWSNIEDVTVSFSSTTVFTAPGMIFSATEWEATGFNNGRRMVRDANGYFHAFWHSQTTLVAPSGFGSQIYYSYTTVAANEPPSMAFQGAWVTPINMTQLLNNLDNRYPSVAIGYDTYDGIWSSPTANVLHIVWQANTTGMSIGRYDILYARITVTNPPTVPASWTWPRVINLSNTTTDSLVPAIAINQHGGVGNQHLHVVWQEEDYNGTVAPGEDTWFSDILYRRSNNSGATWSAIQNLSNSAMNSQMPSISCILDQYTGNPAQTGRNEFGYNSNDVHVVYNEDFGPGFIHIFYLRSPDNGVTWNPRIDVSTSAGGMSSVTDAYPNIAIDMLDNPHIVFMRNNIVQAEPLRSIGTTYLAGFNPTQVRSFPGPDVGMYGALMNMIVYAYSTSTSASVPWDWHELAYTYDCEFPTVALDRFQHVNVNWQEFNYTDYEIMRKTRLNLWPPPPTFPILLQMYSPSWSAATSDSNDSANDDLFPNLAHKKVAFYRSGTNYNQEFITPGYDEVWTKIMGHGESGAISGLTAIMQDGNMRYFNPATVPVELSRFDTELR